MARQRITTYAMSTPERRLQLDEEIRARRAARVAAGLPSDSPESKQDGEEGEPNEEDATMGEDDAAMEKEEPKPTEEGAFEEEPKAEAAADMANVMAEFKVAKAEEFKSEHEVEANRRILRRRKVEIDKLFTELEDEDESDVRPIANDHKAGSSDTNFVDISDDEDEPDVRPVANEHEASSFDINLVDISNNEDEPNMRPVANDHEADGSDTNFVRHI